MLVGQMSLQVPKAWTEVVGEAKVRRAKEQDLSLVEVVMEVGCIGVMATLLHPCLEAEYVVLPQPIGASGRAHPRFKWGYIRCIPTRLNSP